MKNVQRVLMVKLILILASTIVLTSHLCSAQSTTSQTPPTVPSEWKFPEVHAHAEVRERQNDGSEIGRDRENGSITALTGRFKIDGAANARDAAEKFLKERSSELRIRPDLRDLRLDHEVGGDTASSFTYQVLANGLPVFEDHISLVVANKDTVEQVDRSPLIVRTTLSAKPKLTKDAAVARAKSELQRGLKSTITFKPDDSQVKAELGYFALGGPVHRAWRIELPALLPRESWLVILDDNTNQIVGVDQLTMH